MISVIKRSPSSSPPGLLCQILGSLVWSHRRKSSKYDLLAQAIFLRKGVGVLGNEDQTQARELHETLREEAGQSRREETELLAENKLNS